jgi:hypothetical protein
MKSEIKKYPLINVTILSGIFDSYSDSIKQAVQHVVVSLKSDGKKYLEKEKLAAETRKETLSNALANILNVQGEGYGSNS